MSKGRLLKQTTGAGLIVFGLGLFLLNLAGGFVPLRAPEVTGYVDFAGGETRTFGESMASLQDLKRPNVSREVLVADATRIFHEGVAHIAPEDVAKNGYSHYGMSVPPTENWVLFFLSLVKPDTYRDYEFCHYRRVLRRGTGRCGQNALGLVSFLSSLDINTGFVALGGHAIATAEVRPGVWHLLDPDYGGVIPFDIEKAQSNPRAVLEHYWSEAAEQNRIDRVYAPNRNEVRLGGVEARYGRACAIETASYAIKWAAPALMFLLGMLLVMPLRKGE